MEESSVRTSLDKLCQELNMDEQTAAEAMKNFSLIWNTHTLEVLQASYSRSASPPVLPRFCCSSETALWLFLGPRLQD